MSGLQETFYIVGIVFMGVIFIILIVLVSAVFVIRSKVNRIHAQIESKINTVTHIAEKSGEIAGLASRVVASKAKKAVRKAKK
jgi:Na+-transporting methylmalonyl-CoA/oxaloacetate decarboxylase gamma subunit